MKHNLGAHALLRGMLALASLAAILLFALWPQFSAVLGISVPTVEKSAAGSTADTKHTTSFGDSIKSLLAEIAAQEKTDELILAELQSGAYSAEEPLIIENPYGSSPLTALIAFTTAQPASVQVRVMGKTRDADIAQDFSTLQTEHLIPIYGLYQDFLNTVTLTVTDAAGEQVETTFQLQTDAIMPEAICNLIIQTDFADAAALGAGVNFLYFQKLAFDAHGDIRWLNNSWVCGSSTLYHYGDGTYVAAYGSYLEGDALLIERNFLGKFLRIWYSPYGIHHDITQGTNENLLATGSKGLSIEDIVFELDGETGEIVHTLDLKTVLPRSSERISAAQNARFLLGDDWDQAVEDWFHLNAIVWDDGDLILSGRHSSAVVKLAWPTGKLEWILASPYGWLPMFEKYLLTPIEDQAAFEWSYWQHAPYLLPDQDNNSDTMDILLFDNGTIRFGEADVQQNLRSGNINDIQKYSRMVQYRINEKDGVIEQVWQYGKERGEELFSARCGDADVLSNGNRMGMFLIETRNEEKPSAHTVISEVTLSGDLVWEALLTADNGNLVEYRTERLSLYRDSDQHLQLGQTARIFIPEAVLEANGVKVPLPQH